MLCVGSYFEENWGVYLSVVDMGVFLVVCGLGLKRKWCGCSKLEFYIVVDD